MRSNSKINTLKGFKSMLYTAQCLNQIEIALIQMRIAYTLVLPKYI